MALLVAATHFMASPLLAEVTSVEFIPRETDANISESCNSPQFIFVDRGILVEHNSRLPKDRNQMLLFLDGTGGTGGGAKAFCGLAAELGYHVINLTYPSDTAASVCASDPDPKAFEDFRMAIIQGGNSPHIRVDRADSIENRLEKLLILLVRRRPKENWQQFLDANGKIRWESIAVAGQSQGGGHAALIAIKHRVARVIATGAPKDYSKRLQAPAAWYRVDSATPKTRFFTFNHAQDPQGCTPAQLLENMSSLGLDAYGKPIDAATARYPYHHTRILVTSFPHMANVEVNSEAAKTAHGSVIATANAEKWKQVWTYMLTENAD